MGMKAPAFLCIHGQGKPLEGFGKEATRSVVGGTEVHVAVAGEWVGGAQSRSAASPSS